MVHINIICVGKIKEKFFNEAIKEYSKRLSRFCILKVIEINDEKIPDNSNKNIEESIKNKEGNSILSQIKRDSYTIALDLNGKEYDSISLSKHINSICLNQNSTINFIIGGSLGLSKEVLDFSNESICFSKLTFPHQLFRVLLLEQLYRSFKIMHNETYHK